MRKCLVLLFLLFYASSASALMFGIDLGKTHTENGIKVASPWSGDGYHGYTVKDGVDCRIVTASNPWQVGGNHIYFDVDNSLSTRTDVWIAVEYFDEGTRTIRLDYDSAGDSSPVDAFALNKKNDPVLQLQDTKTWRIHIFNVSDSEFKNQGNGHDFRLRVSPYNTQHLYINRVWLSKHKPSIGELYAFWGEVYEPKGFARDENIVATYYFYWFDVSTHDHMWFQNKDALQSHPPDRFKNSPSYLGWTKTEWHRREMLDMIAANIDVVLPVYWGCDRDKRAYSIEGLRRLVEAQEQLIDEGYEPPKIGMFYDTTALKDQNRGTPPNLTTSNGKALFYGMVRDFYKEVPIELRAEIEGRPITWIYSSHSVGNYNQSTFTYMADAFRRDFSTLPYVVLESSWQNIRADDMYRWCAAPFGPFIDDVAAIGPGHDNTAIHPNDPTIKDRENGEYYKRSWETAIASGKNIVAIETWNEFHEDTVICDTQEYGRYYIDLTAKYARRFKGEPEPIALEDVNEDGVTNIDDLAMVIMYFGVVEPSNPRVDIDKSGVVDIQDVVAVLAAFHPVYYALDASPLALLSGILPTQLYQNYPNPFNPETWIPYSLSQPAEPVVRIYSSSGRLVRTLEIGYQDAGLYVTKEQAAYWDGRSDIGEEVSSGVYFYSIAAEGYASVEKMTILR